MKKYTVLLVVFIAFLALSSCVFAQSSTVRTRVGSPRGGAGGWPTSGIVTQGPLGAYDHGPLRLNAIDVANAASPPVYSAFDGTVSAIHDCSMDGDCSRGWGGYGNSVVIQNASGGTALYGHLSIIEVKSGQIIAKGEELGIMGTTGVSTGIHLHFELIGIPLEPPNIPIEITPLNCDTPNIPCNPSSI